MQPELSRRLILAAAILAVVMMGIAAWTFIEYRDQLPPIEEMRVWVVEFLRSIPAPWYFLAFAILPALGAPLTLFYLTALPILGEHSIFIGIVLALLALALNLILTYWLARGILHPAIEWVVRHRHYKIPKISAKSELQIVLAFRVSPLPFAMQNYLLALGHSRWRYYLFLSLLVQGCIGIAMMLVGESILTGGLGYVFLAIFLFLVLNLTIKFIRNKLNREPPEPVK